MSRLKCSSYCFHHHYEHLGWWERREEATKPSQFYLLVWQCPIPGTCAKFFHRFGPTTNQSCPRGTTLALKWSLFFWWSTAVGGVARTQFSLCLLGMWLRRNFLALVILITGSHVYAPSIQPEDRQDQILILRIEGGREGFACVERTLGREESVI